MEAADVQKATVKQMIQAAVLVDGAPQFLVSARWWLQFSEYVQFMAEDGTARSLLREAAEPPPPIDNSDLLAEGERSRELGILRPGLLDGQDYDFVPPDAWEYLHGMYGGGPTLQRKVIMRGTDLVVERYPLVAVVETLDELGTRVPGAAAVQMISRDAKVQTALASLGSGGDVRLWAHANPDLVLADGEDMDASTLRGWKCVGVDVEESVGDLQLKDGQTLLVETRGNEAWKFEESVRRAAGSAHWKDPSVDALTVGDRVDFDAEGRWLSAVVVAVRDEGQDRKVQLCCPALANGDDTVTSSLARMSLEDPGEVEEGPTTPWVQVSAGRMAKWHTHELADDDRNRQPFGPPRDLRAGDECEVQRDGGWSKATVQQVDWYEMLVEVKTEQGSFAKIAIDGEDLAKPGSMIFDKPAGPGRAGGGAAASSGGDRYALPAAPEFEELGGICGLANLGNTCFMNSALQALSNTPSVRDYFLAGQYEEEINMDNPVGHKGKLASAFGELMQQIWSNRHTCVSPTVMKRAIGDAFPDFAGYQQHDSHELLSSLLDAIHEDLNRIKKKPYLEPPEHDGTRPDDEVAALSWEQHLMRNQSVIVDHFHGQLKSEAKCLECNRSSVTFDAVMYHAVPLPQPTTQPQQVTVVRDVCGPGRTAVQMMVEVPRVGVVGDMRSKLVEMTGIDSARLFICEIYQTRVYKVLSDTAGLTQIRPADKIFAYELEEGMENPVQVINRKPSKSQWGGPDKFAYPLVVGLPTDCTNRDVYAKMQQLGNATLKDGQAERFLRMQEASQLPLDPAVAKAKDLIAQGDAQLDSGDPGGANVCFTEGIDTLASHITAIPPGFEAGDASGLAEVILVEHTCRLGRASCSIARAEAETRQIETQALLKEAVNDCELVLQQAPDNVRALYLRGRAGALRADGLIQNASILCEMRYAKGLLWKASELDGSDKKIGDERVALDTRLQQKEEDVNRTAKATRSSVKYVNKRSSAVELHWVKPQATANSPIVTKKMTSIEPNKDYDMATKIGDRFVVYAPGDTHTTLHEFDVAMKPNVVFLHDEEEEQTRLWCEHMLTTKGGLNPRELEANAKEVVRLPPTNECYTIMTADASRSDKGKPLPNDDESFATGKNFAPAARAVCLDWTPAGLDARDGSKDKEDESASLDAGTSIDGALPLTACLDKFVELETLANQDSWYCPHCKDFVRSTKKFSLWTMPNILIFQLKRFATTSVNTYGTYGAIARQEKITTPVDFPDELDLTSYVKDGATDKSFIYDLYAVVNHSGGTGGGHYYTYARTLSKTRTAEWYNYNDSFVSKMSKDAVRTPNAYMLFYQRRDWNGGRPRSPEDYAL